MNAQWWNNDPYHGGGFPGFDPGSFPEGVSSLGPDSDGLLHFRMVHGILATLAIVILFPSGAILMRLVPGRLAVWVHGAVQIISWVVFIVAAGLGIYLAQEMNFFGGNLVSLCASNGRTRRYLRPHT